MRLQASRRKGHFFDPRPPAPDSDGFPALVVPWRAPRSGRGSSSLPDLQILHLEGDTCDLPREISGAGRHSFRIREHSASGFQGSNPCGNPAPTYLDQFFRWTAEVDGDFWFDTKFSNIEAYVTAYDGRDCTAPCIGVADPASAPQGKPRLLVAGMSAGDEVLIQVSADWDLQFVGDMDLAIYPDACSSPDPFEPNDVHTMATPIMGGSFHGLSVSNVTDDVDYFSLFLEPGEAVFLDTPRVDGAQVFRRGHGSDGTSFSTYDDGDPTTPYFVNTRSYGSTFYVSILSANGNQLPCASYDLELSVGQDTCYNPAGDHTGENDTCLTALSIAPGIHSGHFVSMLDPDYYEVVIPPQSTFRADFFNTDGFASSYTDVILRPGCGGAALQFGSSNGIEWTNASGTAQVAILEVRLSPASHYVNRCATYSMRIAGGDPIGTSYCAPTVPNSSGSTGKLSAFGSRVPSDNSLTLTAYDLPSNPFGYYIGSQTQGSLVQPGGSQGTVCLDGNIARFRTQAGNASSGVFVRTLDLFNISEPPHSGTSVVAGQTWNFQLWHRDFANGVVTSNFTAGISILYQ